MTQPRRSDLSFLLRCIFLLLMLLGGLGWFWIITPAPNKVWSPGHSASASSPEQAAAQFGSNLLLEEFILSEHFYDPSYLLTMEDTDIASLEDPSTWICLHAHVQYSRQHAGMTIYFQDSDDLRSTEAYFAQEAANTLQVNGISVDYTITFSAEDSAVPQSFDALFCYGGRIYWYTHHFKGGFDPAYHSEICGGYTPDQPFAQAVYAVLARLLPEAPVTD